MPSSATVGVSDDFIQALGPGGRILAPLEEPGVSRSSSLYDGPGTVIPYKL